MRPWILRIAVLLVVAALGVALGAGPLQRSAAERDQELDERSAQLEASKRANAAQEKRLAAADGYAAATAPTTLRGTLAGRSVVVVTLPGADPDVVAALGNLIGTAQGKVTAQVALTDDAVRPSGRQLVEALTSQMLTQTRDVTVASDANGYARLGSLLARAVGSGPTGQPAQAAYDPTAVGIVSGLESAELVELARPVAARAGLVLVVTGRPGGQDDPANAVPVTVLDSLARSVPTVVVGPVRSAGGAGLLASLRGSGAAGVLSTVDGVEGMTGQVAAALALAFRARGTVGHYGVLGADGAVPTAR